LRLGAIKILVLSAKEESMKKVYGICLALMLIATIATRGGAQNTPTATKTANTPKSAVAEREPPLFLNHTIPLEGVKGRFDHFGTGGGKLFVAELGNNSVAVINSTGMALERTITGVPDPQGVTFSPEANKLFIASGTAQKLYIYDGTSFDLITSLDFPGGADNLRYDAATRRVYVGCGSNAQTGAIVAVDAMTNQRLDEYKVGGEPESFQLEAKGPNIYVNLEQEAEVAVINRTTKAVTKWPLTGVTMNFPMALDEPDHRLFIGTMTPARLVVVDTNSGHIISVLPSAKWMDDLWYDALRKRIYMTGAEGFVYVVEMKDPDHYQLLAKIPTAVGAATSGYFGGASRTGKGIGAFYVAVPARGNESAEIRIYGMPD
jgi:DNA-binding beta-propeller fold protein YncE